MEIESGQHIILDMYNIKAELLWDESFIRNTMIDGIKATGANVLHDYFHHFGEQYGVTGIVAVSESHTSIHTWPEWNYAAVDVFLCRGMDPKIAAEAILKSFECTDYSINEISRKAKINNQQI